MQEQKQDNRSGKKLSRHQVREKSGKAQITVKKDDALKASEERFSAAFRFSPIGMAIFRAADRRFVDVNDMFIKASGYAREEIIGHTALELNLYAVPEERGAILKELKERDALEPFEFTTRNKSGEIGVGLSATTEITLDGEKHHLSMILDITERKHMEDALRESEKQIKQLIDASPVAMVVLSGIKEHIESVNYKFTELFGYTIEDMPDMAHWWPLAHPDEKYREEIMTQWNVRVEQAIRNKGQINPMEATVTCRDGSQRYIEFRLSSVGQRHLLTFVDLTERKRVDDALHERERHSQSLLRLSRNLERAQTYVEVLNAARDEVKTVIGYQNLWAYLLTEDKKYAKALFAGGPLEKAVMAENGAATLTIEGDRMLEEIAEAKEIVLVEDAQTDERTDKEIVARMGNRTIVNIPIIMLDRHLGSIGTGTFGNEGVRPPTRTEREYLIALASHMAVTLDRIHLLTERRHAEQALRESEEKFRAIIEQSAEGVALIDEQGNMIEWNQANERMTGLMRNDVIGMPFWDIVMKIIVPERKTTQRYEFFKSAILEALQTGSSNVFTQPIESEFYPWQGQEKHFMHQTIFPVKTGKGFRIASLIHDITERKQHEREREAIVIVSNALRQATTRTEILTVILDQLVHLFDADGAMLVLPNSQTGGFIDEIGRGTIGEKMAGLNIPPGKGVCNWVITNKKNYLNNHADQDPLFYRSDLLADSHCVASVPLIAQEQTIGALWFARHTNIAEQDLRLLNAIADIAANAIHRVQLHEQTEEQLHHLIALHQIDLAISSNFDSNITLNVILNNVKDQLEVDAASILLFSPVTHTLDYAAGIGFRTHGIEQSHVRLGDGYAGSAAQEYRTVSCPDLKLARETFSRSSLLADEEFESHYATPLVVKGQVKGVLELFHRKTFEPEPGWLNYFETLATQAAIAIESASMLENLQRSNMELIMAYDATIEGWSRALDLRDRETEGHTQRVAEMALDLAEKMGMSDTEKLDLRRGALLHDIGKMGVPDSILLKPGSLSESEWEVMRKHPLYAYQMLSPISYLKRALEISYCHHEKWDGSGYPRGLKRDEIPLPARVFAVVDVFDALTSDRPYRKAWPREDVYRYIEEQAGKHFDPQVVKIFIEAR